MSTIDLTKNYSFEELNDILKTCPLCSGELTKSKYHSIRCSKDFCFYVSNSSASRISFYLHGSLCKEKVHILNNIIMYYEGANYGGGFVIKTIENNSITVAEIKNLYQQLKLLS